ncbi:MAG TPA: rRNA adenine N-6-methyltransferase family protein [Gammaproteobacteria bacterium]|nr:rRNA adenine N-6-methyltransferase family protein [Gammaproteobacteria bacterium]
MQGPLLFLTEFLRHPSEVASLVPSTPALKARIVRDAEVTQARTIIELGPGTGGTTHAILEAMAPGARLLAIEINARFHQRLRRIDDTRLVAHLGSAAELSAIAAQHGLPAPEVVISGIPFSKLSTAAGEGIIRAVADGLAPGGRFVAYQVSDRVARLAAPVFGPGQRSTEWLSVPPIRVFRWERPAP